MGKDKASNTAENSPPWRIVHNWDRVRNQWDFSTWGLREFGGVEHAEITRAFWKNTGSLEV